MMNLRNYYSTISQGLVWTPCLTSHPLFPSPKSSLLKALLGNESIVKLKFVESEHLPVQE